tara:strand:+ start:470 stop:763 length:294 start_codon:yes stop_codon:yes gene_type:complete
MVYYSDREYRIIGYEKSNTNNKMYDAILQNKNTDRFIRVPFGSNKHENYADKTGLNLYPHLIHGDKQRAINYRARAKGKLKKGYYSPSYFAFYKLWM